MAQKNKIAKKYLTPYVILLYIFVVMVLTSIAVINTNTDFLKNIKKTEQKPSKIANAVYITLVTGIFIYGMSFMHKSANKFASKVAKGYVEKAILKYPELEPFKYVLQNPNSATRIANDIVSNLSQPEQKYILEQLRTLNCFSKQEDINSVYDEIVRKIEQHNENHPEFLDDIYYSLLKEHYAKWPVKESTDKNNKTSQPIQKTFSRSQLKKLVKNFEIRQEVNKWCDAHGIDYSKRLQKTLKLAKEFEFRKKVNRRYAGRGIDYSK